jgi:transcriptional regulator of aromatic amino acid metabolism
MIRSIVDPNAAVVRSLPRTEQDLFIAARHSQVLAFDNISEMSAEMSDALCRLSTGGSFGTRRLYRNEEQVILTASNPVIMNGIENVVTRLDLADRAIVVRLTPIGRKDRQSERDLRSLFHRHHPSIFGALLDAMATGLAAWPHTYPKQHGRMADFEA